MNTTVKLATLAVITSALLTGPARAEVGCEKAENLAKAGVLLFKAEQYGDALKQFQAAYRLFKPPKCFIDNVVWNIGRCHEELGNPEMALRFFEQFAKYVADIGDSHRLAAADNKIAQIRGKLPGVIRIVVDQPAAVVSVDGEFKGRVSEIGKLNVEQGTRSIVVSAPGFIPYKDLRRIEGGKSVDLKIALQPNAGTLKVITDVKDSGIIQVFVDGREVHEGKLPFSTKLQSGTYLVAVGRDNTNFVRKSIEIKAAGVAELMVVSPAVIDEAKVALPSQGGEKEVLTARDVDGDVFKPVGPGTIVRPINDTVAFSPSQTGLFWGGLGVALAGAAFNVVGYLEVKDIGNGTYTYDDARTTRDGAAWKYYAGYACYGVAGAMVLASFVIPDYGKKHALGFVIFPAEDGGTVAMTGRF